MDCPWSQKVSQLIDEELSPPEVAETTIHLSACEQCQQTHDDFLRLRNSLKAHDFQLAPFAKERAMSSVARSRSEPFWKRTIAVPVPVMVTMFIAIIALALWVSFRRPQTNGLYTVRIPADKEIGSRTFDLSRFDHGERATIAKVKQAENSQGQ